MKLILRPLDENDETLFLKGLKDWSGEDPQWYSFIWQTGMAYKSMLEDLRKESLGIDLKPNRVQHTMLYAFVDKNIVGRVSVRHELNDYLRHRGGHIGYAVAPKYRRQGYATEMLKQALEFCRSINLFEIMITCADDNTPSWKLIEKYNGKLQDKIWDDEENEMLRRYWITLD